MDEGFVPYPEWQRTPGSELNVQVDVELYRRPDYGPGMMMITEPTGRRRIIIEGTAERLAPYEAAIAAIPWPKQDT